MNSSATLTPTVTSHIIPAEICTLFGTARYFDPLEPTPDAWELAQLQRFEERKAAGENPTAIETGEYVELNGKRVFRYMKAIPTGPICLNCHGGALTPDVSAKLKELYPDDKATGFKIGDLRGAFTVTLTP